MGPAVNTEPALSLPKDFSTTWIGFQNLAIRFAPLEMTDQLLTSMIARVHDREGHEFHSRRINPGERHGF